MKNPRDFEFFIHYSGSGYKAEVFCPSGYAQYWITFISWFFQEGSIKKVWGDDNKAGFFAKTETWESDKFVKLLKKMFQAEEVPLKDLTNK